MGPSPVGALLASEGAPLNTAPWEPVLSEDIAAPALAAARDVAARLTAPRSVDEAAAAARAQTAFPRSTHWIPYSISQGNAGLALLWGYMDACFPRDGWDRVGREHLEIAARGAEAAPGLPVGLFSGASGLAFAASELSRNGTRYQRLLGSLDDVICPQAINMAENMTAQRDGITVGDFDVISGLSGLGAYLLTRRHESRAATVLCSVIRALVELTELGPDPPRWHTPSRLVWDEGMAQVYPHGNLNCGLAHGIPGPLALLSLSHRAGVAAPGLPEAIAHVADWLCRNRLDDEWGANWPTAVPLDEVQTPQGPALRPGTAAAAPDGPSRCAWCYGSPGVARSLWLAGEALNRDDYRAIAIAAMEAVFRRPVPVRRIDSPTFCHGVAGLLHIALRFAHDTRLPIFADASRTLVQQLLDRYQPESLLAFRNIEVADHEIDQPGLLDGAPGVALVLLASATTAEPTWDRLFLLS
jgi:hypothetical protein